MWEKISLIKGGYSVEVSSYDGNKMVWGFIVDHVVKNPKNNSEIEPQGFNFNFWGYYKNTTVLGSSLKKYNTG